MVMVHQRVFGDFRLLVVVVFIWCFSGWCAAGLEEDSKDNSYEDLGLNTIEQSSDPSTNPFTSTSFHSADEVKYFTCPQKDTSSSFYALPCDSTKDCAFLGGQFVCCSGRCVKGIPISMPKPKPRHSPTFFGLVDRVCPLEPLVEIFAVKQCLTDDECFPRICCPEGIEHRVSYCRTPTPNFEQFPGSAQFLQPLKTFISYMQCTPPPPPFLDFFPKPCRTQLDCFPNLCCQERDKKFCRPPKRSILGLIAGVSERFGGSEVARRFLSRIN